MNEWMIYLGLSNGAGYRLCMSDRMLAQCGASSLYVRCIVYLGLSIGAEMYDCVDFVVGDRQYGPGFVERENHLGYAVIQILGSAELEKQFFENHLQPNQLNKIIYIYVCK